MKKSLVLNNLSFLAVGIFAQLPKVELKDKSGKSVSIESLSNEGKPFIIGLFTKWYKPYLSELDTIAEVYEDWQEETGVKLVAVSIDQAMNANKVKPLADSHNWEYEVLLDPNSYLKSALGVQMISYVINMDGQEKIVYKHNVYTVGSETELIEKVHELVKKK